MSESNAQEKSKPEDSNIEKNSTNLNYFPNVVGLYEENVKNNVKEARQFIDKDILGSPVLKTVAELPEQPARFSTKVKQQLYSFSDRINNDYPHVRFLARTGLACQNGACHDVLCHHDIGMH